MRYRRSNAVFLIIILSREPDLPVGFAAASRLVLLMLGAAGCHAARRDGAILVAIPLAAAAFAVLYALTLI